MYVAPSALRIPRRQLIEIEHTFDDSRTPDKFRKSRLVTRLTLRTGRKSREIHALSAGSTTIRSRSQQSCQFVVDGRQLRTQQGDDLLARPLADCCGHVVQDVQPC